MHPKVLSSTIYRSQVTGTTQELTDSGVDGRHATYAQQATAQPESGTVPSAATRVHPEALLLSEVRQKEKGKSHISLKHGVRHK